MIEQREVESTSASEFRPLSEKECLERIRTCRVGRLGVWINEYPMIFPVNFVLVGDMITFRTDADTKFNAAHYSNVSFEVDELDLEKGSAWSVMVLGQIHVVDTRRDVERRTMDALNLRPLAPGERSIWVQIVPSRISGRQLTSVDAQSSGTEPLMPAT